MGFSHGEFDALLKKIRGGEPVDDSRLLPFLTLEALDDRRRVNAELAEAYYRRHGRRPDAESLRRARASAGRALLLSQYSPEALEPFVRVSAAAGDAAAIAEAFKRVGIEHAERGRFDAALALFDRWAYAYGEYAKADLHSFDADILASVERMAALRRFEDAPRRAASPGGKIRLACLMQGLTEVNSVLVKIDRVFARLHDKSRFEVAYFAADAESAVALSQDAQETIRDIRGRGWEVTAAPDAGSVYEQLIALGRRIHDFAPDVLVTSAALATFKNYFVTCLKPAPVTVALHQGPSPQFSWHTFDHSISWFLTTLPECPTDCSHVPLEFALPERADHPPAPRAEINLPEGAAVMVCGGRRHKFQDPSIWRVLNESLQENDGLYMLAVGISEEEVPILGGLLTPEARAKIRFLGWSRDYLKFLAAGDFVLDSYPVGGGVFPMEAMGFGIPVISFEHDYVNLYDNNDCSGGREIVGLDELIVRRGDFAQLKRLVSGLAADAGERRRLGRLCYERVRGTQGDPARMVRRCEEVYERVLRERRAATAADAPLAHGAARPGPPAGRVPGGEVSEEYRRMLVEQADLLGRREAELSRREALHNARLLPRLERSLRWRWRRLRGR